MTAVTIEVTPQDIADGKPGDACDCPVYLAIARTLRARFPAIAERLIYGLSVSSFAITIGRRGAPGITAGYWPVARICPPEPVVAFVPQFDTGCPVKPFTFTLDIPAALLEATA